MAVVGGIEFPDDCIISTQFAVSRLLKDLPYFDPVAEGKWSAGREIGSLIAQRFPWDTVERERAFQPELYKLSVVVLTQDQLADIVRQARSENYEAGYRAGMRDAFTPGVLPTPSDR